MNINKEITDKILASEHLKALLSRAGWVLQLLYSIVTLFSLVVLIINITKLSTSGGNPMARSEALRNILISGIALTVLGSMGAIYAVFVGFVIG